MVPPEAPFRGLRVVWVSPRKTTAVANAVAANVVFACPLHELLASVKLPLDELSSAHLVVMEVPPAALSGFEHSLLRLIVKIRELGVHVAVVVQPNLRRQTQQPFWVQRWNRLDHRPFTFVSACSCRLSSSAIGCHHQLLIGSSYTLPAFECSSAPTLGATPTANRSILEDVLRTLCVRLCDSTTPPELPVGGFDDVDVRPDILQGPQRTPDSLSHGEGDQLTHPTCTHKHPPGQTCMPSATASACSHQGGSRAADSQVGSTVAYPTNSKEKEKHKKKLMKEAGQEITVKKKKFHIEEHYDDCGEDLSSLREQIDEADPQYYVPADYDTDQALSDDDHNFCLLTEAPQWCYGAFQ